MPKVSLADRLRDKVTTAAVAPVDTEPATESAPSAATQPAPAPTTPAAVVEEAAPVAEEPSTRPAAVSNAAAPAKRQGSGASRAPKKVTAAPASAAATEPATAPFAIELSKPLDDRLTAYRSRTRKSHHAVMLDAVESTYDQLEGLISRALGRDDEPAKVNLFGRSARVTAPVPAEDPGEKVTHTFRVTKSARDTLTDLAQQFGAPSRNFLVVTALDAFLPPLD